MSLNSQSTEHTDFRLSSNNGAHVLHFESPPNHSRQPTEGTAETHGTTPRRRLSSMTLDELSEELHRRTKETQRLQELVENAAKEALQRFGCTYVLNNSPGQSCHKHRFNVYNPPVDFTVFSAHEQTVTEPWASGQGTANQSVVSSPDKDLLNNKMDVSLQQMSDAQLNKTQDQLRQETFSFDKAIVNLQNKLHVIQMEKDAQSDLRLKESKTHVDQMEKMLCFLEDLQNIKSAADHKLQKTEAEALALNRKVEKLEEVIKEIYSSLLYENWCGSDENPSVNITTGLSQTAKLPDDFKNEIDNLQGKAFVSVEHKGSEECSGLNKEKERMEDLIASLGQEMALLTGMLSSSKKSSVSLGEKLDLLKKLAKRQTSLQPCQVSELESTLSSHKDKIYCLEQQLIQAQSQLVEAQARREQTEELQSQLGQLKRCGEQQQSELQVMVSSPRAQLEVAGAHLRRGREEKMCLHALLERKVQEERETQVLLQEKDDELELRQQEIQQHLSKLEEAQSRCQTLHAEGETLRLKLEDKEKIINILTESGICSLEHHSHTIENLHQENSFLSNQLNHHKLEIQHLTAELDQHKSDLANVEHEKQQLQASVAEQSQHVLEESVKKRQLITQLENQGMQLLTLTKEHTELQRLHSCKTEEQKGVVLELQRQLRNAHCELDQVRTTLRNLEGADEHGLQAAMDMQKEITVRREQVDTLQGKILHQEEALDKMYQKKRYQILKSQRQLQELTFIKEEKRQLANELEVLRSKDQHLRDRIGELEAILHKMSERFTCCKDFIQLQEQEFFRLKLQHALDLKELQGKHLNSGLTDQDSMTPSAVTAPPSMQHFSNTQTKLKSKRQHENPTQEHRSVVKEHHGVISENSRPHTDNSIVDSSFHSEPHLLMTAELNGRKNNSFADAPESRYAYFPQLLSLGRKSPVHSLLTSDPNS